MRLRVIYLLLALSLLLAPLPTLANSGEVIYVPISPFVTNYGGPGRLKYVKVDMTLMVTGVRNAQVIEDNLPLVRNTVVMNLSRQSENNVVTPRGQERIRQQLRDDLRHVLETQVGAPLVDEVLFTNFIFQN
ncbi:flagellar basal body-associated FliL family protein [Marinospirillum sp. MEB164]|uniref:Flagellar protein FliL n=1 Tax=Marinospirillum alkalitolerans TaxID=3123374 RepID=A0ABW8Q1L9_9GAMM